VVGGDRCIECDDGNARVLKEVKIGYNYYGVWWRIYE
jgi:hypothetical protein